MPFDFTGLATDTPSSLRTIEFGKSYIVFYHAKQNRYYRVEQEELASEPQYILSERKVQFGDWHFMISSDDLHRILRLLGWKTKETKQ